MRALLALAILAPALAAFPPAAAGIDACSAPTWAMPTLLFAQSLVQGSTTWQDGSCNGLGVVGAPGNCASAGQLCVGPRAAGSLVLCAWFTSTGSTVRALAIGVDTTGDGNVFDNQDPAAGVDAPSAQPTASSPHSFLWLVPASGDVIVYPVSSVAFGSPFDATKITCA